MNNYLEVENFVKKKMMELVRYKDKEQNNLLSFAVQCGYYDIAELLIKNGLPINTKNVSTFRFTMMICLEEWKHPASLRHCIQAREYHPTPDRQWCG